MLEKIMNLLTPGRRGENMTRDTVTSLLATCHRASEAFMYNTFICINKIYIVINLHYLYTSYLQIWLPITHPYLSTYLHILYLLNICLSIQLLPSLIRQAGSVLSGLSEQCVGRRWKFTNYSRPSYCCADLPWIHNCLETGVKRSTAQTWQLHHHRITPFISTCLTNAFAFNCSR